MCVWFFFFLLFLRPALFSSPPLAYFFSLLFPFFAPSPVQLSSSKPSLGLFPHGASWGLDCLVPYLQEVIDTSLSLCLCWSLPVFFGVSDLQPANSAPSNSGGLGNYTVLCYTNLPSPHAAKNDGRQVTRAELNRSRAPQLWTCQGTPWLQHGDEVTLTCHSSDHAASSNSLTQMSTTGTVR